MKKQLTLALIVGLVCAPLGVAQATEFFVRPTGTNGDGKTYGTAWVGMKQVQWDLIEPGDVLFICGTFINGTAQPAYTAKDGQPGRRITISGLCVDENGNADKGVLERGPGAALNLYGISTKRKDYYTFSDLLLKGVPVMIVDSDGTHLVRVVIQDVPFSPWYAAAISDRGLSTTLDSVQVLHSAVAGYTQKARGRQVYWPTTNPTLLKTNISFLRKEDFQARQYTTTIRNSRFYRLGRKETYDGYDGIELYWFKDVVIENTSIIDPGTTGIRVSAADAHAHYPITDGDGGNYCPSPYQLTSEGCLDLRRDTIDKFDAFDRYQGPGPPVSISPHVVVDQNVIEAHFQTGPRPQCIVSGGFCATDDDCVFGYACVDVSPDQIGDYRCRPKGTRCSDQHAGVFLTAAAPWRGRLEVTGNLIGGFAGNGVLAESDRREPNGSLSVLIQGNKIWGSGHFGIWIAGARSVETQGWTTIADNEIYDNGFYKFNWIGGIQINHGAKHVFVYNNFIYDNGDDTLTWDPDQKRAGIVVAQVCLYPPNAPPKYAAPEDVRILYNTLVNNLGSNLMTWYACDNLSATIQNLMVRDNLSVLTDSVHGSHVLWQSLYGGIALPVVLDEPWLADHNLYYTQPHTAGPVPFRRGIAEYYSLAAYQLDLSPQESTSVEIDPMLDDDLMPQNQAAELFGVRP